MHRNPDSFRLPGGDVGCLLVHGFTNSPYEMRPLGDFLAARGLAVSGVRLAGHGTSPEDLERTTWHDWVASAEHELSRLKEVCRDVFVAGQSGGGVIALYLAMSHTLAGAVVMSAPVYLRSPWLPFLPMLRRLRPWYVPTDCDLTDTTAKEEYYTPPLTYERKPVAAIEQLVRLQAEVRRGLARICVPLLLVYGRRDRTIDVGIAWYIFDRVASQRKRLLWMANSGHGLVVDSEKESVWAAVYGFVREMTG